MAPSPSTSRAASSTACGSGRRRSCGATRGVDPARPHQLLRRCGFTAFPRVGHRLRVAPARLADALPHRKEFFRASLEEIEHIVRQHHGQFRLTRHAEAIEYRKTLAIESGHVPAEVAQRQAGGARVQAVAAG